MWQTLLFPLSIVMLIVLGPILVRWNQLERRTKRLLQSRESVSPCEWITTVVHPDNVDQAESLLDRLGRAMRVDPLKLRAEDRFDTELRGIACNPNGDSDDLDECFMEECEQFGLDYTRGHEVETVAEYVRFFCSGEACKEIA